MKVNLIVAVDKNYGIGLDNKLPWKFSQDMLYFKNHTKGAGDNAIIMGKNTYLSIKKTLPCRDNIILSTSLDSKTLEKSAFVCKNITELENFISTKTYDDIWVIGGSSIYKQFLEMPECINKIFITEIDNEYNCDTFFPRIPSVFLLDKSFVTYENDVLLKFSVYKKT
jgi:dihydrofolate reductase